MENSLLEQLQNEVKDFYEFLSNELKFELSYKIFFSKFSPKSDILFIGINPGAGEQGQFTDALKMFEYINPDVNDYTLANETRRVFEIAGYPNLLEELDRKNKVVKTNFYYFSDTTIDNQYLKIDNFYYKTLSNDLRNQYWNNSLRWTKKVIELTNPKLIICEGKSAFDLVNISIEPDQETFYKHDGNLRVTYKDRDLVLLAYERLFSNIKNKEGFAKLLQNELENIYR